MNSTGTSGIHHPRSSMTAVRAFSKPPAWYTPLPTCRATGGVSSCFLLFADEDAIGVRVQAWRSWATEFLPFRPSNLIQKGNSSKGMASYPAFCAQMRRLDVFLSTTMLPPLLLIPLQAQICLPDVCGSHG